MRDRRLGSATAFVAAFVLIGCVPASAADANRGAAAQGRDLERSSESGSNSAKINELQKRLDERDSLILDLLDRVERLERQSADSGRAVARPVNAVLGGATMESSSRDPNSSPRLAQQSPNQPGPPPASPPASPPAPANAAPGQFTVSEEDAQRALERALVQTGASLLQPGQLEFVPSLIYQFDQVSHPSQIALSASGSVFITEDVKKTTQLEAGALLRVGLPWDMQAEIEVPYDYKGISNASEVLGSGLSDKQTDVAGLGDPSFTLTRQVMYERNGWPGLFASGTWNSDFGNTRQGIALGSGFNEFSVGLTAVRRQDPLVFTAGFTYQTTLEKNNVSPGDQYIPAVGMLFAVSPETSLRFAQQVSFVRPTGVSGRAVPGSDLTSGIFTFGLLSILGRGLTLDLSAGIGETPDAPDLNFRVAFPIRLN